MDGLVNYADTYMGLAEPALRKVIELNPVYADAWAWLGLVYMAEGRTAEALDVHKMSARLSPLSATALMNLSMAHQAMGDFEAAIRNYEKSAGIELEYGNADWGAAYAYWRRGMLVPAVARFCSAAARNVVSLDFFAQYALTCFLAGCTDEAVSYTNRAVGIDRAALWSLRAIWAKYLTAGDLAGLIAYLEQLERSSANHVFVQLNLARAYAVAGRWRDASEIYETHFLSSDPWFFYHWDADWGFSHGLMLAIVRGQLGDDNADVLAAVRNLVEDVRG